MRKTTSADRELIRAAFYDAIFVPEGEPPLPFSIVDAPELLKYTENWGRSGDAGLIAETDGRCIGAVWSRLMRSADKGYGHIADDIPELGISVKKEYRGKGIGGELLAAMLDELKALGYRAVSLSVQKENRAKNLYLRAGFIIHEERGNDFVMIKRL